MLIIENRPRNICFYNIAYWEKCDYCALIAKIPFEFQLDCDCYVTN